MQREQQREDLRERQQLLAEFRKQEMTTGG
jgi:hypothetical protein